MQQIISNPSMGQGALRARLPALLALLLPALLAALPLKADTLLGRATHVRDGDTIEVQGVPIRLKGIAAPELDEKWGRAAKDALQRIVAGQRLRCELSDERTHGRRVGVCYLNDGSDIAAALVRQGLARDCPRYSDGRYAAYETAKSKTLPLPGYCRMRSRPPSR